MRAGVSAKEGAVARLEGAAEGVALSPTLESCSERLDVTQCLRRGFLQLLALSSWPPAHSGM